MSVTHFNLEHKIKPGVKCRINFLACTSPWSITQLLSKPVWGLPPTRERTDQLWYDKYQPLLFSWFCSMLPRCSKKWCPGVHGTRRGCKSTQKYRGKKMPPVWLCHDLTLSSCVPSKKDWAMPILPSMWALQEWVFWDFAFLDLSGSMLQLYLGAQKQC